MDKPVLASVIVVTYNQNEYIEEAIKSIINQKTTFEFEILIGDDCSTDGTTEKVLYYSSIYPNKIKSFISDSNIGGTKNWINLYLKAKGKYIAFCEGDDYWNAIDKLQRQVDFLEKNIEFGLVHSDSNLYYQNSGRMLLNYNRLSQSVIPTGDVFEFIITPTFPMFIKTATAVFRKEIAQKYFDHNVVIDRNWKLSDLPLWLDIAKNSKIHYIDDSLATYRLLDESASRTKNPQKKYLFHLSVFDIRKYYIEKYGCSEKIRRSVEIHFNRMMLIDGFNLVDSAITKKAMEELKSMGVKIRIKDMILYIGSLNRINNSIIKSVNYLVS